MTEAQHQQMHSLGDYLASRRDEILLAWLKEENADPAQTTVHSLTHGQFNDHIPQILDAFERKLRTQPHSAAAQAAGIEEKKEEIKHGLHRWQLGYRLLELMREWGHLQHCLFEEIGRFAAAHPEFEPDTLSEANRLLLSLVNEGIGESVGQYERLQQAEAAGRMNDLEQTLASVGELERRRTALIHQAVHDLRSNVQSVSSAAEVLVDSDIADEDRMEFTLLLQQGVALVSKMLGELMDLARLEAGQDRCQIAPFDAVPLLTELCDVNRPLAAQKNLYLKLEGPPGLPVIGDAHKVRRIAQNLVVNALKYTVKGGVTVSWGTEEKNWWLMIQDTGPGMLGGPGSPLLNGLKEATASAQEADERSAVTGGETIHVIKADRDASAKIASAHQQPGEGIGLSIVKRLCELLHASLELKSSVEKGSTFRVVFPKDYPPRTT